MNIHPSLLRAKSPSPVYAIRLNVHGIYVTGAGEEDHARFREIADLKHPTIIRVLGALSVFVELLPEREDVGRRICFSSMSLHMRFWEDRTNKIGFLVSNITLAQVARNLWEVIHYVEV